jgi:predicted DNA-binding WGR domain protein
LESPIAILQYADEGAALAAARRLLKAKLRRGYQAVAA